MADPEVAQTKEPVDVAIYDHVRQYISGIRVFADGLSVKRSSLAIFIEALQLAMSVHSPGAAVLQLQVGVGYLPAVVLAADQVEGRNPCVFKEYAVLVPFGFGCPCGREVELV